MRKLLYIACASLVACACSAAPRAEYITRAMGTNSTLAGTNVAIVGYIDEVVLELASGSTSGTVVVAATPEVGSAVTLATKAITATTTVRPRLDGTDTAGTALTGDPPGRYLAIGDKLSATWSKLSTTGLTWRVLVKFDDGR